MASWHLDTKMAQDIVARTMRIIDTNINVMDARGRIIGSGDRERIGELHEGALLVLSQGRVVDIDDAVAKHLHGVRQGINFPLRLEGEIVGVIGLTGENTDIAGDLCSPFKTAKESGYHASEHPRGQARHHRRQPRLLPHRALHAAPQEHRGRLR